MEPTKITPMMQQYLQIKERYRDAILFFRLGDFYEMFFEDAQTAAKILDIALTSRNKSDDQSVPLCGVPYHSAEPYIQKLLDAGHKVAICEQVEDPKTAKGVGSGKYPVTRTVTAAEARDARGNNYLAAASATGRLRPGGYGYHDGEFRCTEITDEQTLSDEIARIHPSELLLMEGDSGLRRRAQREFPSLHLTPVAANLFSNIAERRIATARATGAEAWENGVRAASAIIAYLEANAPESLKVLRDLEPYMASLILC
jgi:DNA mismatch repair protein MutS